MRNPSRAPLVAGCAEEEREDLHPCPSWASPTVAPECAFRRLVQAADA